ncbi:MAG: glycosyl hydrolase family 2, partial [Lentisphaerota bacterium]
AKDCLDNKIRAWFNFEHEESAAQPNWNLSGGYPWHRQRSYEVRYDKGSIGRTLTCNEWRVSQGWQAFSCYESMRKQIFHGVAGFSWCTIEGGGNAGTYEKPLLDPSGHAKLAWYVRKLLTSPVLAGSADADTVYGPKDKIIPVIHNVGPARQAELTVTVKTPAGGITDTRTFVGLELKKGRSLLRLPAYSPTLPADGYCVVDYSVKYRDR